MNNMNNNSLPELKIIAEALKSLKEKKIIRTKNLVGDLGEYYCKEYFGLTLEENAVNKGFDAIDKEEKKLKSKQEELQKGNQKLFLEALNLIIVYM